MTYKFIEYLIVNQAIWSIVKKDQELKQAIVISSDIPNHFFREPKFLILFVLQLQIRS